MMGQFLYWTTTHENSLQPGSKRVSLAGCGAETKPGRRSIVASRFAPAFPPNRLREFRVVAGELESRWNTAMAETKAESKPHALEQRDVEGELL